MKKRMLTLTLVFSLILGIFPVNAFAAQQGTKTRVYTVMICDTTIVRGSRPMEYQVKVNEQFYKTVTGFNDECYMMLLPVDNEMPKIPIATNIIAALLKTLGTSEKHWTGNMEYSLTHLPPFCGLRISSIQFNPNRASIL